MTDAGCAGGHEFVLLFFKLEKIEVITAIFLFFGASSILTLLYGHNYADGAPVVRWIAVAVLANAVTGTNASLLRAFGHTREIFLATAAGGIVAIGGTPADQLVAKPDSKWVLLAEMTDRGVWQPCRLVSIDGSSTGRHGSAAFRPARHPAG